MTNNRRVTGKATSMPMGLLTGGAGSLLSTIVLAGILAKLLEKAYISQENTGYGVMIILLVSAYVGAAISSGRIKRQRLLVCLLSGAVYFVILLSITALFFGGQYDAVAVTGLLVLCGCMAAALLHPGEKRGGKRKKIKLPNC